MADYRSGEDPRSADVPPDAPVKGADEQCPSQQCGQAVRDRVVDEIQGAGDAWSDADVLDTDQQENRPEQVGKLRGEQQRAQRRFRGRLLRPQSNPVMAEAHRVPPLAARCRSARWRVWFS